MCWLVFCPKDKTIPLDYMDRAQKINKDGYGISWCYNNQVQVFKTLDYIEFKEKLATLTSFDRIVHFRLASVGTVDINNVHPFNIPTGVMFHNGTISTLRTTSTCAVSGCSDSDTSMLAKMISECKYSHLSDIQPLVQHIIGTTVNKLLFMEHDGTVTIMNKNLGNEEDGIWYSNTYHKAPTYSYPANTYYYNNYSKSSVKTKVFVYGTLKKGYANNYILAGSTFLGKATTNPKGVMIGEKAPFPYLLEFQYKATPGEEAYNIEGEVYEVDEYTLDRLDRLEGVPHHYRKSYVMVTLDNKESILCLVYLKTTITASDKAQKRISSWKPSYSFPYSPFIDDEEDEVMTELEEAVATIQLYSDLTFYTEAGLASKTQPELVKICDEYYKAYYGYSAFLEAESVENLIEEIGFLTDCINEDITIAKKTINKLTSKSVYNKRKYLIATGDISKATADTISDSTIEALFSLEAI